MSETPLPCPLFTVVSNWPYRIRAGWSRKYPPWPLLWCDIEVQRFKSDPRNYVIDFEICVLGTWTHFRYYSPTARKWYSLPEDDRVYDTTAPAPGQEGGE